MALFPHLASTVVLAAIVHKAEALVPHGVICAQSFSAPSPMQLSDRALGKSKRNKTGPARIARRLPIANGMLAALPRKQHQRPLDWLESVALSVSGDRIRHVYFPNDALVSLPTLVDLEAAAHSCYELVKT